MKYILAITAVALLGIGTIDASFAQGNKTGFSRETTQGNSGKTNTQASPTNQGQKTVSGPKGQIDKGNTTCNNCSTNLPGRNR